MNTPKSTLVMFGIALGICLVVLNILLIACCLHKRHKKNLKGGKCSEDLNFYRSIRRG